MDRKELIREYRETPKPMGVIRIRNTTNGKALVEATRNIPALFNRHRATLRMGGHPNKDLAADWKTDGEQAFAFEVLDTLEAPDRADYDPTTDLRVLEDLWLEKLQPFVPDGYNRRRPPRP